MPPAAARGAASASDPASPGLRLSRLALGLTERLWPALALRAALRLFSTPRPARWLQRHPSWGPQWRRERWPFEDAALTLYTRADAPAGPVALLVHGWGGQAGQLRPLAEAIVRAGLRPLLLELPAHGRSPGATSNLPQFARAIAYAVARLQAQDQPPQALVAHSLGAAAAAYAASRGLGVDRLVLLAPPASPHGYTRLFAQAFGLSERTRARLQSRLEAREGVLMAQFEPAAVGPRIAARTLVVHDRQDRVSPFAHGQAFTAAIAGAELVATEGQGHRKLLADPAVLARVAAFVAPG